jgi:hypothetical protein
MMYILTQEEYDALEIKKRQANSEATKILQDLCTRVANSEPVKEGWYAGKPWGCILTKEEEWYCDDCPVQEVCPKNWKRYSK